MLNKKNRAEIWRHEQCQGLLIFFLFFYFLFFNHVAEFVFLLNFCLLLFFVSHVNIMTTLLKNLAGLFYYGVLVIQKGLIKISVIFSWYLISLYEMLLCILDIYSMKSRKWTNTFKSRLEIDLGLGITSNRKTFKRKLNNTQDSHVNLMVETEPLMNTLSHKIGERIFLSCDQCLWAVTCINKKYLQELSEISEVEYSCPICNQDQVSSFPITSNNTFRYRYSKTKA